MFEAVLLPEAEKGRDLLDSADRAEVNRIIRLLELDPWSDDETKATITLGGIGFGVYDDGRWEVVYRVLDNRFIEVAGISRRIQG